MLIFIASFWIIVSTLLIIRRKAIVDSFIENNVLLKTSTNIGSANASFLSPSNLFQVSTTLRVKNDYASDISFIKNKSDPCVYIYNSHDNENYDNDILETYNISYTVKTASYILKDYLSKEGIGAYVEEESVKDYLISNELNYEDSYDVSRTFIERALKENSNIKFLIDIHRDSASRIDTTCEIDGTNYAKVLFVVGTEYATYLDNLSIAEAINSKLDERITRGIREKGGNAVNGIYNQDLTKYSILLEIGGIDNSISEVDNTLKIVAKAIREYLSEEEIWAIRRK